MNKVTKEPDQLFSISLKYSFSNVEKKIQDTLDKKYKLSFVSENEILVSRVESKIKWLSFISSSTVFELKLKLLLIDKYNLYLSVENNEYAEEVINDLVTVFGGQGKNGVSWHYIGREIPQADNDPMTITAGTDNKGHITPETDSKNYKNVAVSMDYIPILKKQLNDNKPKNIVFSKEGLCLEGLSGDINGNDTNNVLTAFGFLHQGIQYEKAGDYENAAKAYRKAADLGNPTAQNNLGFLYANGLGVTKDLNIAFKWYSKAADNNEVWALSNIGDFYSEGVVVNANKTLAAEYYEKAARLGLADAQVKLGIMYYQGDGVQQDNKKALELFLKAGKQDDPNAQRILGIFYHEGIGTEKNDKKALEWYMKSAEAGDSDAQCNVATMLFYGQGTAENKKEAKKWLKMSAQQGNQEAIKRMIVWFADDKISDSAEYVDLGLPSGTLWADRNIGAGDLLDAGPSLESSTLPNDIPTYEQFQELIKLCDFERVPHEAKNIWKVIGPNGNSILFVEDNYTIYHETAALCCGRGLIKDFKPFIIISADNITIGMTTIESMIPSRLVKTRQ